MTRLERHSSRNNSIKRRLRRKFQLNSNHNKQKEKEATTSNTGSLSNHSSFEIVPRLPHPAPSSQQKQQQRSPWTSYFWKKWSSRRRRNKQQQQQPFKMGNHLFCPSQEPLDAAEPLVLDVFTTRGLRLVTLSVLVDKPRVSWMELVRAWKQQAFLSDLYAASKPTLSSSNNSNNWMSNNNNNNDDISGDDPTTQRQYEWMAHLEAWQKELHDDTISSWPNVVEILGHRVQFLPEEDDSTNSTAVASPLELLQRQQQQGRLDASTRELRQKFQSVQFAATPHSLDPADGAFLQRLHLVQDLRDEQRPAAVVRRVEEEQQRAELEAQEKARLLKPLSDADQARVQRALHEFGPPEEVMARAGPDVVQRGSIQRLLPGEWLNDEVIQFFLTCLANRDEAMCAAQPGKRRSHFMKTFFLSQLLDEGHADPSIRGVYNYKRVKRWSKKVPGKDIFQLDKIVFPINQGGMHWVTAVAYMQEQRIQFFDSLHGSGGSYLRHILHYFKDEHQDKKGTPLPNPGDWKLVECDCSSTPRQLNGFDCGVFTCMFCDFLSKDCPLTFGQREITQCRERIVLSILNGKAIM